MKITEDVREYARQQGLSDKAALTEGMKQKADEFQKGTLEIYHKN